MVYREDYKIAFMLSGNCFIKDENPLFSSALIRLRYLDNWVEPPPIVADDEWCGDRPHRHHLYYEHRNPISVQTCIGKLTLAYIPSVEHHTAPPRAEISSQCSIGLAFEPPVALDRALNACAALRNIMTIGVDSPTPISSLLVRPSEQGTAVRGKQLSWWSYGFVHQMDRCRRCARRR